MPERSKKHVRCYPEWWQATPCCCRTNSSFGKLDVEAGATVEFDKVLLVANAEDVKVGVPYVEGSKVTAEVVAHGRGKKVTIVKFRRRKHSRKQAGHRQWFTEVKITAINA